MRHLFVTKDIALLAKEAGFDEPCLAIINREGAVRIVVDNPSNRHKDFSVSDTGKLKAPTWQQLIDWLRTKHNTIIRIDNISENEYSDGFMNSGNDYYTVLSNSIKFWLNIIKGN